MTDTRVDSDLVTPAAELPRVWTASQMAPSKPVRWLARHLLALGMIALLVGDEGIGKSLFWVLIVAKLTRGEAMPELGIEAGEPKHIVLLLGENGWADMDRPRLEEAGADLDFIHLIATSEDGTGAPAFTPFTRRLIDELPFEPALIIADPWLDTVPGNFSVKDGQQAKAALRPWRDMAIQHNAAVLLVCHTNRQSTANARDKYGATAELRKTARMSLFAQLDDETGLLTIGPEKSNIVPRGVNAAQFQIVSHSREGFDDGIPVLNYVGTADYTSAELLASKFEAERDGGDHSPRNEVDNIIREILRDGPVASNNVYRQAEQAGVSKDQAKRAKARLKIEARKEGDGGWYWVLPTEQEDPISHTSAPLLPSRSQGVNVRSLESRSQQGSKRAREQTNTSRTAETAVDEAILNALSATVPKNAGFVMKQVKAVTGSGTATFDGLDRLEASGQITRHGTEYLLAAKTA